MGQNVLRGFDADDKADHGDEEPEKPASQQQKEQSYKKEREWVMKF